MHRLPTLLTGPRRPFTCQAARGMLALSLVLSSLLSAPAAAVETRLLRLHSDPGDWIGKGADLHFTGADGAFSLTGTPSAIVVIVNTLEAHWRLEFGAPAGTTLAPGLYEKARRWPFNDGAPGISIDGNEGGCNEILGRFTIKEIEFSGARPTRFWAVFEQHCENGTDALWGEIRFDARVLVDIDVPVRAFAPTLKSLTIPVSAEALEGGDVALSATGLPGGSTFTDHGDGSGTFTWTPDRKQVGRHIVTFSGRSGPYQGSATTTLLATGDYLLSINSDPDHAVGQGDTLLFTPDDGWFLDRYSTSAWVQTEFQLPDHSSWRFGFHTDGTPITPRFYTDIRGTDEAGPGLILDVSGNSMVCGGVRGWLQIKKLSFDLDGRLESLWATLEHHCARYTDPGPALFAEVRFNSPTAVAVNPIPTQTAVIGHRLEFPVVASDVQGRSVTLAVVDPPPGSSLVPAGAGMGSFQWTPEFDQAGDHVVFFQGSNQAGDRDSSGALIHVRGETSLTLREEGEDGIEVYRRLPADGEFEVLASNRARLRVTYKTPNYSEHFLVELTTPSGVEAFTPGFYETGPGLAGLSMMGRLNDQSVLCEDSGGMSPQGAFEIRRLIWGGDNQPEQLYVAFSAPCKEGKSVVRGELRIDARVLTDLQTPVWSRAEAGKPVSIEVKGIDARGRSLALSGVHLPEGAWFDDRGDNSGVVTWVPDPSHIGGSQLVFGARAGSEDVTTSSSWVEVTGETWLNVHSEAGDPVGEGLDRRIEPPSAEFDSYILADNSVHVRAFEGGRRWTLHFAAGFDSILTAGEYENVTRWTATGPHETPGILIERTGETCGAITGRFTVHSISYGLNRTLKSLHASFRQTCEGAPGALAGELLVNSSPELIPVRVLNFNACPVHGQVRLQWVTGEETSAVGFDIWRHVEAGDWEQLNVSPITGGPTYDYLDPHPPVGQPIFYFIDSIDLSGHRERHGPVNAYVESARNPALAVANNPTRSPTRIRMALPLPGRLQLSVFDVAGRRVRLLMDEQVPAGWHEIEWDLRNDRGQTVPAGVYSLRLATPLGLRKERLVVLR